MESGFFLPFRFRLIPAYLPTFDHNVLIVQALDFNNLPPEFDDHELKPSAERFEAMLKGEERAFFDSETLEELFDYFIAHNKADLAEKVVDMGLRQNPFSAIFFIKKAQLCLAKSDVSGVFDWLKQAEILEPHNHEIPLTKGSAFEIRGEYQEAIQHYKKAEELAEDQVDVVYACLGNAYLEWGKFSQAIYYYQLFLKLNPQDNAVLDEIAWCYAQLPDWDAGEAFFQQLIDEDPFNDQAWYQLSNILNRNGRFEEALDALDYCLAINAKHQFALYTKANVFLNMGKYKDALEMLMAAHQEDSKNASVICGIGVCYEKLNQIDEATYWYRRSVETDRLLADGWFGLGICSLINENFLQSESFIKKALEINPEVEEFWYSLSEVYENLGFFQQARTCYEAALAIDPRFMEARVDFAILLASELQNMPEALLVLNKGFEFHPKEDDFLYRYAGVMLDWGFLIEARDALENALFLNYDNHSLFFDYSETAMNHPDFIRLIETYRS